MKVLISCGNLLNNANIIKEFLELTNIDLLENTSSILVKVELLNFTFFQLDQCRKRTLRITISF